jgi:hypothetical protein
MVGTDHLVVGHLRSCTPVKVTIGVGVKWFLS